MDKQQLRSIMDHQYELPTEIEQYEAVQQVVSLLGSTDPELRDDLAYGILYEWLITQKILTAGQLTELLHQTLSDQMLFKGIGTAENDSVFQRTFSALLLALLLKRDEQQPYISKPLYEHIAKRVVDYCMQENDYRDYVEVKGWAHAPAHIADVMAACVRSPHIGPEECKKLLSAIEHMLLHANHILRTEEDERMATAVLSMLELNKLSFTSYCAWLMQVELPNEDKVIYRCRRINVKNFARSVWMRAAMREFIVPTTEWHNWYNIEKKLNPVFNRDI
ncbi:DUF2785 domain-containing protein [Paenibacillus sp. chi10]|uniref:DUF2785 domain-containing protein n=1 Tax=Paenibacillus suaedae TaxID=3077233 RepID=A0AAJ2K2B7_9BACL|nr:MULTISPECIES: DUF2785 domain-containing protein [unclassified Paenibacillus]MDT8979044.1 DUF2785 domain-containing protein [Paenibacillus sp. chi10]GAV13500.1 hypothetical protein PBN151_3437 [Paenibacillus sp. NAIST15-1]